MNTGTLLIVVPAGVAVAVVSTVTYVIIHRRRRRD